MGSGVNVFKISYTVAAEIISVYQVGLKSSLNLTSIGRKEARKKYIKNKKKKLKKGSK